MRGRRSWRAGGVGSWRVRPPRAWAGLALHAREVAHPEDGGAAALGGAAGALDGDDGAVVGLETGGDQGFVADEALIIRLKRAEADELAGRVHPDLVGLIRGALVEVRGHEPD